MVYSIKRLGLQYGELESHHYIKSSGNMRAILFVLNSEICQFNKGYSTKNINQLIKSSENIRVIITSKVVRIIQSFLGLTDWSTIVRMCQLLKGK